ncbi:transaldolase family protein [Actinomadura roseirufa]|uniref:transaldolase family protein n=1 Tax=Actinomadura roseirufa TaxID=2094049 RepID=UPI0013F169D9|nr:transaldolase family protein [Actinomadura roseirufa]
MKIFFDGSDLHEIGAVLERGLARGITTNPTQISEQAAGRPLHHIQRIVRLVEQRDLELPISVQVMAHDPGDIEYQARRIIDEVAYKQLVIKIPCSWELLPVISRLAGDGVPVNCTACVTVSQSLIAASAGARYVSLFCGKMSDAGLDPATVIAEAAPLVEKQGGELIAASLRRSFDVPVFARAGAHITTLPLRYLEPLAAHPKTVEAVDLFARNYVPLEETGRTEPR